MSKELGGIAFKHISELLQHVDRCSVLLALEHADIVAVDTRTVGEFLLRQAFLLTQPAKVDGDKLPQSHAEAVAGSLI
jgi:hypothetical protein